MLTFALALLLTWLHYTYQWEINFHQFSIWLSARAEPLLIVVSFLLSFTLIASAFAYRQTCRLSKEDYHLWLQQRATRTFLPFFTPMHDWLRLHLRLYRWWHTQIYSTTIHVVFLLFFVVISFSSIRGLYASFPTESCGPSSVTDINITVDTTWSSNQCTEDVTVTNNATLTINGGVAVTAASLTLGDGVTNGNIIFKGDTLNDIGVLLNISGNIDVKSGSTISGNGQGYLGGTIGSPNGAGSGGGVSTTLNPSTTYAGGGGYGGAGATNNTGTGGSSYGSATAPDNLGSGGAYGKFLGVGSNGGTAGAAIRLISGGTFTINGTVSANGSNSNSGGGSGGTISLRADTFTGSGSITANGGNGGTNGGGGGGGRILRQYRTAIGSSLTVTATMGTSGTGGGDGSIQNETLASSFAVSGTSPVTAGSSQSITVTAKDLNGSTVTGYTGTVSFSSTDSQAVLPGNYTFVSGDNGVKTFTGVILKTAGSKTITATDTSVSSVTGAMNVTVNPAITNNLSVSGIPSPITAGTAGSVTVTAKDAYGNTVTGFSGTVSFVSSDAQATLPASYTYTGIDAGSKTFTNGVTLKTAGTQSVTASALSISLISGQQANIQVNASTVTQLTLTGLASTVTAGDGLSPIVSLKDSYGNNVTSYTGSVHFSSTDSQAVLPTDYTFTAGDNGSKTFAGTILKTAGSQSITVTEINVGEGTPKTATATITVNAGSHATYSITATSPQKIDVGWSETVTAKDSSGNTVALGSPELTLTVTSTGNGKYFTSNSYATETSTYSMSSSTLAIYVKDSRAENIKLTVSDNSGRTVTSSTIRVLRDLGTEDPNNGSEEVITPPEEEKDALICPPNQVKRSTTTGSTDQNSDDSVNVTEECVDLSIGTDDSSGGSPIVQIQQAIKEVNRILQENDVIVANTNNAVAALSPVAAAAALGPISTAIVTTAIDGLVKGASLFNTIFGVTPVGRRRRRRWGIVRSLTTGLPLGGVFVELVDKTGQVINKTMTDRTGRYGFLISQAGQYQLQVNNPLYGRYWSKPLIIKDPNDIIDENITLQPIDGQLTARVNKVAKLLSAIKVLHYLHWPLMIFGSALAAYVYYQDPTIVKALILALYGMLWVSKLIEFDYKRPYGVVLDAATGAPQAFSVVQISSDPDVSGSTVVRSTITDSKGRFLFVVKPDMYHLVAAKEGYRPTEMLINGETVNLTVKLQQDKTA